MPREVRALTVCVVCWARRGTEHPAYACIHHKCVCCGFKAMEAAVKASRSEAGAIRDESLGLPLAQETANQAVEEKASDGAA